MLPSATPARSRAATGLPGVWSPTTLAALAGVNLWAVASLLPTLFALPTTTRLGVAARAVLALAAPLALALGLGRRAGPAWAQLLVGFPLLVAAPDLAAAVVAASRHHVEVTAPVPLAALSYALYLWAAANVVFAIADEGATQPLPPQAETPKVRKRRRLYLTALLLSGVVPLLALLAVDRTDLASFGDRAEAVRALLVALVGGAALAGVWLVALTPLLTHVGGDRQLRDGVRALTQQARHGRPALRFYAYVLLALAAVVAIIVVRN